MRTGEMLGLRWEHIDFLTNRLSVEKSKTQAGVRCVPISAICKSELLRWRSLIGPEYSEWVFPSFSNRRYRLQGGRKAWASELKKVGIPFFPIYNLRHVCNKDACVGRPSVSNRSNVGSFLHANRSAICPSIGPERVRCDEKAGISSAGIDFESNRSGNSSNGPQLSETTGPHKVAIVGKASWFCGFCRCMSAARTLYRGNTKGAEMRYNARAPRKPNLSRRELA
jgi:hypothetical protein